MDRAVVGHFAVEEFATAQVDTASGELRWINAGNPAPLLIRGNRVVRPLHSQTTLPVGFDGAAPTVGREQLHPGDRVLCFTDGASEQRTRLGDLFFEDLATGPAPPA